MVKDLSSSPVKPEMTAVRPDSTTYIYAASTTARTRQDVALTRHIPLQSAVRLEGNVRVAVQMTTERIFRATTLEIAATCSMPLKTVVGTCCALPSDDRCHARFTICPESVYVGDLMLKHLVGYGVYLGLD